MTRKIKVSKLVEFVPSKYLDDDEAVADYIRLAIEDGDTIPVDDQDDH